MDDKDIERILKDSANKTALMPSEERWNRIKDRLDMQVKVEEPVLQEVTVAASAGNVNKNLFGSPRGKITFGFIVCCVCLILCLAIVLPIYFSRPGEHRYMGEKDLIYYVCLEEEFERGVKETKLELIDYSEYKLSNTHLYKDIEGNIQGGGFVGNLTNLKIEVKFLSGLVKVEETDFIGSLEYNITDTHILYKKIENSSPLNQYQALAKRKGVTYKIEYTAVEDNVLAFFDEFFK